ncbi:MAG: hypothetical protein HYS12_29310 [Planctomycetes bacterium]|nr:hypothetical protein [Planctomycetota bacterium]
MSPARPQEQTPAPEDPTGQLGCGCLLLGAVSGTFDGLLLGCLVASLASGLEGLGQFLALLSACAFGGAVLGGLGAGVVGRLMQQRND